MNWKCKQKGFLAKFMQIFQDVYKLLKKCENINVFVNKED